MAANGIRTNARDIHDKAPFYNTLFFKTSNLYKTTFKRIKLVRHLRKNAVNELKR